MLHFLSNSVDDVGWILQNWCCLNALSTLGSLLQSSLLKLLDQVAIDAWWCLWWAVVLNLFLSSQEFLHDTSSALGHVRLELAWTDDARSVEWAILPTFDWAFTWTSSHWVLFVVFWVGILVDVVVKSIAKSFLRRLRNYLTSSYLDGIDLPAGFGLMIGESSDASEWTDHFFHTLIWAVDARFMSFLGILFDNLLIKYRNCNLFGRFFLDCLLNFSFSLFNEFIEVWSIILFLNEFISVAIFIEI